jgi:hypothetical protein
MDLKDYYQRMKELEESIPGAHVVIVSLATPDGGRQGQETEVPKAVAARLVLDKKARLATEEETRAFEVRKQELRVAAEAAIQAQPMQFVPACGDAHTKPGRGGQKK